MIRIPCMSLPTNAVRLLALTIVGLLFITSASAQTIQDQVREDSMTYVFKLNNEQLNYIFEKRSLKDTSWLFENKIDSGHYNKFDINKLPYGCFLKTHVSLHKVHVEFVGHYPFDIKTKTIKDQQLLFLAYKKTKQEINEAQVTVQGRASNYDKGFGAFVLNINEKPTDKKNANKYIRIVHNGVDYYYFLKGKVNYISTPSPSRGVSSSVSPGYFIVSQPKYRHLDSVKYKAYLINPYNGKPMCKKASLQFKGDGKTFWTKKIKRSSLGAYHGQFFIPDSLKIDKEYQLIMSYYKRGRRFSTTESFRIEDYALDKNNYDIIVPQDTFKAGQDMEIFAKATDANGFALGDTRLKLKMSVEHIIRTDQDTIIFKKDEKQNWYSLDTLMDELEMTKIVIPTNRLINGLVKYKLVFDLIDVRQEKKRFVKYVYWNAETDETIFTQKQDSIVARQLYKLKDTARFFDLLIYQDQKLLDSSRIKTPFTKQIKYNYTLAELRSVATDKRHSLTIRQSLLQLIDLSTKRTHDSVKINASYPLNTPLHYKIYKEKKEVASGTGSKIKYAVKDNTDDDYYLLLTANLNGNIENNFEYFRISQDKKKLELTTNFPEKIYPGDAIPVEISVKDYKGQARENINITTYAVSSMFKNDIEKPTIQSPLSEVPQLEKIGIEKSKLEYRIKNLRLSKEYMLSEWMVKKFNLYKNDFYKIHYPIANTYTHYLELPKRVKSIDLIDTKKTVKEKAPTQFSVLPILGRRIVRPQYVRMNKQLVYHSNTHQNLPYSTAAKPGTYTIEFRFQDKLISCPNVVVKPNQKTLLCVNMDSIIETNNRSFIISDSLPIFSMTNNEFTQLDANSLFIHGLYFDTLKVYPHNDEANAIYYFGSGQMGNITVRDERFNTIALPPTRSNQKKFILEYNDRTEIINNENLSVAFLNDKKTDIRRYDTATAPPFISGKSAVAYSELLSHINTVHPPVAENAVFVKPKPTYNEPTKRTKEIYRSPVGHYAKPTHGALAVHFDISNATKPNLVATWIINKEDSKKSSYYTTSNSNHRSLAHYGGAGTYDIYLLYNTKEYVLFKNQKLDEGDYWYINSNFLDKKPIDEETLIEPISQFNQLTQKPLVPFVNYPNESKLSVKIVNTHRRNIATIQGVVRNYNGRELTAQDVYLEKNGKFVQGATTNRKGQFEFLSVSKGRYMLKIFNNNLQPRYAYDINIDQHATYTYNIEMKYKNYLKPDLQINENEVRLQIFQSKNNANITTYGKVYDLETRAPIAGAKITYLTKEEKTLSNFVSNQSGSFDIYAPKNLLGKSYDVKISAPNYRDIYLKNVLFVKTNANQLSVFMRTKSNNAHLPIVLDMGLQEDIKIVQAPKAKQSDYKKIKKSQTYSGNAGGIDGKIIDEKGETVPFASIGAFEDGALKGQSKSDINGNYKIRPLNAGEYSLIIKSVGYKKTEMQGVRVNAGQSYTVNVTMQKKGNNLKKVVVTSSRSMISTDNPGSSSVTMNESSNSYSNSGPSNMPPPFPKLKRTDKLKENFISGDRDDGKLYIIDGMMVRGSAAGLVSLHPKKSLESNIKKLDIHTAAKAKSLRTNFSNLGYWVPNLVTNKNGKAFATLQFPDDVTMWKSFVVAMGRNYYNKVYTADIKSYKPIMVNSIVPRFLYQSDKLLAKAKFLNFDKEQHNIAIKISVDDEEKLSKNINLDRQYVDSVILTSTSTDSLKWRAELDMNSYYKDGEELNIPVFKDGLETSEYDLHVLKGDSTKTIQLGENTETTIYFNNTILENILVEIDKLKRYPYSCNEQKSSKIKGLLLEAKIRKQLKQPFENKRMTKKLINELENAQNPNGAWGWWGGRGNNDRMTIYIAEVLNQANTQDYNTRAAINARDYIRDHIKNFNTSDKLYALYLLKKMNTTKIDYDKLTEGIEYYDLNACDKLYYISNQNTYKNKLSKSQVYDCLSQLRAQSNTRYSDNFFFDPSANMALAIKLLEETSMKNNVLQSIGPLINSGKFISNANTFSKAYLIEAWLKSMPQGAQSILSKITINDTLVIDKFPYKYTTTAPNLAISHTGAPVWSAVARNIYLPNPPVRDSLFNVNTQFLINNTPAEKLTKGQDVNLSVKVMSYRTNKNVMLVVPIPSACTYARKEIPRVNISHIEYYKNKVIYYIENLSPGNFNLSIPLRVNFGGDFSVPPAQASLMYYTFKSGNNTKRRIEVK